jgi:predicted MFS family arabinose efflux permease
MPQFISAVIAHQGWRGGYGFFAGAMALGAVCAQLLMRPVAEVGGPEHRSGVRTRRAVASPAFWLLGLAVLAINAASFGLIAQFQSVLADRGIGAGTAALLLSLLAVAVMVSRLVVGRLLDGPRPAVAAAAVMAAAAMGAALMLAGGSSLGAIACALILLGASIGAELDLMSFFCAGLFGLRHYAAIYGLLSTFFYVGIALGGVAYGAIRTATGSYDAGLAGSGALLLVAAVLFLILGRQRPLIDAAPMAGGEGSHV